MRSHGIGPSRGTLQDDHQAELHPAAEEARRQRERIAAPRRQWLALRRRREKPNPPSATNPDASIVKVAGSGVFTGSNSPDDK